MSNVKSAKAPAKPLNPSLARFDAGAALRTARALGALELMYGYYTVE